MWENAAPSPPPQAQIKGSSASHGEEDLVLWVQLLLCVTILAVVFLARSLNWPFYPALRVAFRQAMQSEQQILLPEERILSKFTEQAAETMGQVMAEIFPAKGTATPETASRTSHNKNAPSVPSGAREDSYLPEFALFFPLPNHACTKTSGYGWRADPMGGSGSDFHLGNDLAAAEGTVISAAADGVVRYAGTHPSYGNYVRILHENGDETLYAHMQYLFVHTGQEVSAGETLGTVGITGNTTGPHLHFELLHKGIRYDPTEALQKAS